MQTKRIGRLVLKALWDFVLIPFKVLKWMVLSIQGKNIDNRTKLAQEISEAALVSMYDELFQRLVMQSHVSSAF